MRGEFNLDSLPDTPQFAKQPRRRARRELIVEEKTGKVRQAGADAAGRYVEQVRREAERSLWVFASTILDQWWLSPYLHSNICQWIQRVPPHRKLLMMPRNHGKSCLVSQALPLHALLQPAESNIYYPGQPGCDTRILMMGESIARAKDHLGVIMRELMTNKLLRALWPDIVWDNPGREARRWNSEEIDIPRSREFPDPSIRAVGVETKIVGAHPNFMIQDDLTTEEAANSPPTMQKAIATHQSSHALLANPDTDLVFVTCTRWAVGDLPDHIMTNEPSYAVNTRFRAMIEDGKPIYPEKYGYPGAVEDLRQQHGVMFDLLYFNTVSSAGLTDFDPNDLREFEVVGDKVQFEGDDRDARLSKVIERIDMPAFVPDLSEAYIPEAGLSVARWEYLRRGHRRGYERDSD